MTRSIEDISKDLAAATLRKQMKMYTNAFGFTVDEIAKSLAEVAALDRELFRLMAEKEEWIKVS